MRIAPISSTQDNYSFRGLGEKVEKLAATLPTKTSPNRKTISIELHNAMVKLTAYRVAIFFAALSGFLGYKTADKISDNDSESFANAVQIADIDTEAPVEVKDMNHDGSADLVLMKKDGSKMILDLKNSNILAETNGYQKVE